MIALGTKVVVKATGLVGTVSAWYKHLGGSQRVCVSALDDMNRPVEHWVEESAVEEVKA